MRKHLPNKPHEGINLDYEQVPCPICGSTAPKPLFRDINRRDGLQVDGIYSRCSTCDMVYLSFRPLWPDIINLETEAHAIHPADVGPAPPRSFLKQWVVDQLILGPHRWPLGDAKPGQKLLDIGCGSGSKLLEFSRRGWEVYGVDINPRAIEKARQTVPQGHFFCAELTHLPPRANFFDFIRIDNCLEHVPNPVSMIEKCFELLKSGGKTYICVPNANSFSFKFMKKFSIHAWIPFHLNMFTETTLRNLLLTAGFSKVEINTFTPIDYLPLSLEQMFTKPPTSARARYRMFIPFLLPLSLAVQLLGLGEELVAVGTK